MPTTSEVANNIASISAFIGLCSAIVAFVSYRKSVSQYNMNKRDMFFSKCSKNLDDSYLALYDFVNNYSELPESMGKRIARDKVVYLLEAMLLEVESSDCLCLQFKKSYGSLGMEISDITFESNFEKITRDVGQIKNIIMNLKKQLYEGSE